MWRAVLATTGNPGLRQVVSGVLVADVSAPASLALALEDDDQPVVIISHATHAHAAAVAATFLGAHQPGRRVAHVSSRHAPLALLLALATARDVVTDAGHAVSATRDVLGASWSGGVLSSVTGLTNPDPPLAQHLLSWVPGSRFLVRLQPDPLSAVADRPAVLLTGLGRGRHDMWVTEAGADHEVTRALSSSLAPASVRTLSLPGRWTSVFGRDEQLQLAMLPTDVSTQVRERGPACDGCGLAAADPVCAFCRTRTPLARSARLRAAAGSAA